MGCQYRLNFLDSPETTILAPQYIGLSTPNNVTVTKALQGAGIVKAFDQVLEVIIHDSLPNYWPDRISVTYNTGSGPTRILLIRIRKDRH